MIKEIEQQKMPLSTSQLMTWMENWEKCWVFRFIVGWILYYYLNWNWMIIFVYDFSSLLVIDMCFFGIWRYVDLHKLLWLLSFAFVFKFLSSHAINCAICGLIYRLNYQSNPKTIMLYQSDITNALLCFALRK